MTSKVPISIPKTLIIIPAYNEEEAIGSTLTRLLQLTEFVYCFVFDLTRRLSKLHHQFITLIQDFALLKER